MNRRTPLYLYNGHFITLPNAEQVRGLIIDHGLIQRVVRRGDKGVQNLPAMNLHDAYVIPGFIDSHTHLISRGIELQRIDLAPCRSLDDCLEKLRSARSKHTAVLFGSNYDETTWSDYPIERMTKRTLDAISTSIPVIMRRVCGHFAVVNTPALKKIPTTWNIVDRRCGHVFKNAALYLNDIFPPDGTELRRAIDLGIREAHKKGITSVHEITNVERFGLLQRIHAAGRLRLRFSLYLLHTYLDRLRAANLRSGFGDDMLRLAGIKIFMDGSLGARTAALCRPYRGMRHRGILMLPASVLARTVQIAERDGYQLMIHSLGDRAVARVVQVLGANIPGGNPLRHRLEHVELLDKRTMNTMAQKHILASMQPNFVRRWQKPGGLYEQRLGERYRRMNCFKNMQDAGIRITFGSDCMPTGPLYGMQGAYAHPFTCGRVSPRTALMMYTRAGAFATHDEGKKGRLKQGFLADLVALDRDPLLTKATHIPRVLLTMVAGNPVYCRLP
ncbi:MAG: amidohydrolase [candidate division WOR-3 bacterium]|nr:MAG: amidohydrolase [candidate division WOR-3 bacterium]